MNRLRKEEGFAHITMTQVLLVLVIIGIVFAVSLPIIKDKRFKARTEQVESDLKAIKKALKAYFDQHGKLPPAPAWAEQPQNATKEECAWQRDLIDSKLLRRFHSDLFAAASTKAYYYYQSGDKNWIVLSVGPDQEPARDYSQDFSEGSLIIYKEKDDMMVSNMDVIDRKQRYPSTSG